MTHSWNLTIAEAKLLQFELGRRVDISPPLPPWTHLAAADVSYNRFDTRLFAAVVVCRRDTLEAVEVVSVEAPMTFPYISGYLSFREAPALLEAFSLVKTPFEVVMCDGQGIAHPRRLGIASHVGLWLEKPTVGCAKSRLFGKADEPGLERGSTSPLMAGDEQVGVVVRTKNKVKPLWVSPGHLCDFAGAVELVLSTTRGRRLPEPARLAHHHVNEARRNASRS